MSDFSDTRVIARWWTLPYGTRFRYLDIKRDQVWVKLGHGEGFGLVAHWDGFGANRVTQGIYSFAETIEEAEKLEVEVCCNEYC